MKHEIDDESLLARGREVLEIEAEAIRGLRGRLDATFAQVVREILACQGRIIVTGMGKSGHIGRKFAATLASLGTAGSFLHPSEGVHGDLGMVSSQDLVVILSHSGESPETLALLPTLKVLGCRLVAIVGQAESTLARQCDFVLAVRVEREADYLNLVPTASTAVMAALGDALAVAVAESRGFSAEDFALFHPGGALGSRLLHTVGRLMRAGEDNPVVKAGVPLADAVAVISAKGMGAANIVDDEGRLVGLVTDGDLRRFLSRAEDPLSRPVAEAMTRNPRAIGPEALAGEALWAMEHTARGVTVLPVVEDGIPIGLIHLHDILKALTGLGR